MKSNYQFAECLCVLLINTVVILAGRKFENIKYEDKACQNVGSQV